MSSKCTAMQYSRDVFTQENIQAHLDCCSSFRKALIKLSKDPCTLLWQQPRLL